MTVMVEIETTTETLTACYGVFCITRRQGFSMHLSFLFCPRYRYSPSCCCNLNCLFTIDNYQGYTLMLTLHQTQTPTMLLLLINIQLDISYDPISPSCYQN